MATLPGQDKPTDFGQKRRRLDIHHAQHTHTPKPSPWHMYKEDLMNLNLQTVSFAADAMRMLNGARLPVNGLYSITGVDWLIAAGINFSSTTALRFADLEGLPRTIQWVQ